MLRHPGPKKVLRGNGSGAYRPSDPYNSYWTIILNMKWKFTLCRIIASYMIPLGGLHALVFTGGIGEKSWIKREKILGNVFSHENQFSIYHLR